MQAIYFPTNSLSLKTDESFYVKCNHDEYSLWFDVFTEAQVKNDYKNCVEFKQPMRMSLISRNRLAQINDRKRTEMMKRALKKVPILC
jgi:hypothetical protein